MLFIAGEVLGFENLIFTIFEFVHALVETSKHKEMIRQGLPDLIYYLLLYMQITEEQVIILIFVNELKSGVRRNFS